MTWATLFFNFHTMMVLLVSLLLVVSYAFPPSDFVQPGDVTNANQYYGVDLPGDVTNETTGRGFPRKIVPADIHGAAQYSGWGETNKFARFYTIQYGSFSMKGEPKHGLWK